MRKVKLSNCGDFILTPKLSTNELSPNNYITTDNMLPNKAGIEKISNIPSNLNVTQFVKNDILLSNIRPYFKKIWLAKFSGGCSADVLIFRTNNNYDSSYIKYCLSQDSFFIYNMAGAKGSKMPRGDKQHILNFELLDFDLMTQKKIGNLLKAIDEKIDLNNKLNSELEKTAKELYDYWFVQFDFPDEKERPYKSSGGAMIYNKDLKREIPVGWEVKELNDIASISNEQITPKENIVYRHYSIPAFDEKGIYTKELGINIHSNKFIIQPCDVLISKLNPRFSRVICASDKDNMVSSTELIVFRCLNKLNQSLMYCIAKSDSFYSYCLKKATGSSGSHNRINPEIMGAFKIPYNKKIYELFKRRINYIIQKRNHIIEENQILSNLRDFLIPLLMNGQVTITS